MSAKIENDGGPRQAAEDSAFACLGSSEHAYHDRLVHIYAFLKGIEYSAAQLAEKDALIAKLQRVVDAARYFACEARSKGEKGVGLLAILEYLDALDKETKR